MQCNTQMETDLGVQFATTVADPPPASLLCRHPHSVQRRYAGMLAVAKCGGPHIEFQPGRLDVALADGPERLPSPVEPLSHSVAYFWTNGCVLGSLITGHQSLLTCAPIVAECRLGHVCSFCYPAVVAGLLSWMVCVATVNSFAVLLYVAFPSRVSSYLSAPLKHRCARSRTCSNTLVTPTLATQGHVVRYG